MIDALGADSTIDFPAALRRVLIDQPDLQTVAAPLSSPQSKQLAYEMALGICDADGAQNAAERAFLAQLATLLEEARGPRRATATRSKRARKRSTPAN